MRRRVFGIETEYGLTAASASGGAPMDAEHAARPCPGVGRRLVRGGLHPLGGEEAFDRSRPVEAVDEAVAGPQVRPLQVDGRQAGVGPLEARALALAEQQLVLADPFDFRGH